VVILDEVAAISHAVKINPGVDEALGYHLAHAVGDGVGDVNAAGGPWWNLLQPARRGFQVARKGKKQ